MSLFVDTVLHYFGDLQICDNSLKNAVVFKIDDVPITYKEIETIRKPFVDWSNDSLEALAKGKNEKRMLDKYETGKTNFYLSKTPYKNILFGLKLEPGYIAIWLIDHKTKDNRHSLMLFTKDYDETINNPVRMDIYLEDDGSIDWGETYLKTINGDMKPHVLQLKLLHLVMMHIAFKLCSIINCKNIETVDNAPCEKHQKNRVRKKRPPLVLYKTLKIKPIGNTKQKATNKKGLDHNKLHICRGHFKNYTTKNPLFGKHTGLYWWNPCVKGNKNQGIVVKDYLVLTQ